MLDLGGEARAKAPSISTAPHSPLLSVAGIPRYRAPGASETIARMLTNLWPRAALAGTVAALALASAAHAEIVDPSTGTGSYGSAPSVSSTPSCTSVAPSTWPTPPRVVIHTKGLTDSGATADDLTRMQSQAQAAVDQFNAMGATSASVASVTTTNDNTFAYKSTSFADKVPTIHVGFVPSATITADNHGNGAGGLTSGNIYLSDTCVPTVTIEFPDLNSSMNWSFKSPSELGVPYYDVDQTPTGTTWFRPSFLHELLHGFQLTHTSTAFAMMNHRGDGFAWGSVAGADEVRPLPDDVRRLRASYPGSGAHWDMDALNNWYGVSSSSQGGAADQASLCTPSVGTKLVSDVLAGGPCGSGGSNAGASCARPGDTVATRYALNNYSTGSLRITSTLSFSADETWDASDPESSTTLTTDVAATTSTLAEQTWKVPNTSGSDLHPIVHLFAEHVNANGTVDPSSLRISWIPLRGKLRIDRFCAAATPIG